MGALGHFLFNPDVRSRMMPNVPTDLNNFTKDGQYLKTGRGWGWNVLDALGLVDKNPSADEIYRALPELKDLGLNESQLRNLVNAYATEDSSLFGNTSSLIDLGSIRDDVSDLLAQLSNEPTAPIYEDYLQSARAQIAAENEEMYSDLDTLLDTQTDLYNRQMSDISSGYDSLRSGLMSQQYRQNASLMDTLQSGMERSRRNALESGASAGIRIADNINTLLSVQNKQSTTSMETANQLAQMMVNQRNAESSARSAYADKLAEDTANRHAIKMGSESRAKSLADTNYDSAYNSYDQKRIDWDSNAAYNPLYEYKSQFKSKYSTGGNQ